MTYTLDEHSVGKTYYGDTIGTTNQWRTAVKITSFTETLYEITYAFEFTLQSVNGRCNSSYWWYETDADASASRESHDIKSGNGYVKLRTRTITKTTSPFTNKPYYSWKNTGDNSYNGISTVEFRVRVDGAYCGKLTFDGNRAGVSNLPSDMNIPSNTTIYVPDVTPVVNDVYEFAHWNTKSDNTGSSYRIGDGMKYSAPQTLYAQWALVGDPPTADVTDPTPTSCTQYVDSVSVDISDVVTYESATYTATLFVGSASDSRTTEGTLSVSPQEHGEVAVYVILTDEDGRSTRIDKGTVNVKQAMWSAVATVDFSSDPTVTYALPETTPDGKAICKVSAKNTSTNLYEEIPNTSGWEYEIVSDVKWKVHAVVGEDYVDDKNADNPDIDLKVEYTAVQKFEPPSRQAFYNTSRNANYQNGFANLIFVSGSDVIDYASRVWYSAYNDPTYFPDVNYVEVGSNDTQVMGLVKIKEYLGVIKQSKTVDTAIYLLYATTYDDDLTFAVKQGVSGIGAIAKYAFNVLGDETLFLSPGGVMAIEPNDDESHKTKNRSHYINKKLLAEEDLSKAYSFVYDGKYYLAVNSHCYVLDGNQKTSWETAKTNLQYEAYYWENVPAICFVKYANALWFTDGESLCRFSKDGEENAYNDDGEPIAAVWSTIFDDDGSIHYYKNMQKKGNVVSILPCGGETSADIYVRVDDKEEVKIGTIESELNRPADFYLKKKFKKYKRMQIIVKNEKLNQGFGVDSIIKNYTIGNYSKNRGV